MAMAVTNEAGTRSGRDGRTITSSIVEGPNALGYTLNDMIGAFAEVFGVLGVTPWTSPPAGRLGAHAKIVRLSRTLVRLP